jgi:hypothetical protein
VTVKGLENAVAWEGTEDGAVEENETFLVISLKFLVATYSSSVEISWHEVTSATSENEDSKVNACAEEAAQETAYTWATVA